MEATRRAHFKITDRGRKVLAGNPTRIDNRFLSQFPEFVEFRQRHNPQPATTTAVADAAVEVDDRTPDDVMRAAHGQINAALGQDLLDRIAKARPEFFEKLIVQLLLAMGYGGSSEDAGRAIGRSGDDGVDGVIDQDPLGLDHVYIQAKRYQPDNKIGAGAIRDFFGSLDMHKAAKGLFVTTSGFSHAARETADKLGKRLVLIGGNELAQLMIRHNVGCKVEETLAIRRVDEDFFE